MGFLAIKRSRRGGYSVSRVVYLNEPNVRQGLKWVLVELDRNEREHSGLLKLESAYSTILEDIGAA